MNEQATSDTQETPQTARPLLSDELGAAMEWKPIETAPKDGTEILAYLITSCESILYMDIISWGRVGIEEDDRWLTCHTEEVYSTPTHWMPLPTPPNAALTGAEGVRVEGIVMRKEEEC